MKPMENPNPKQKGAPKPPRGRVSKLQQRYQEIVEKVTSGTNKPGEFTPAEIKSAFLSQARRNFKTEARQSAGKRNIENARRHRILKPIGAFTCTCGLCPLEHVPDDFKPKFSCPRGKLIHRRRKQGIPVDGGTYTREGPPEDVQRES